MEHDFWLERWREGQLGWHRDEVHPDLVANASWLLEGSPAVLVPLCGKTLDLGWLSQRVQVFGAELSPIAIAAVFEQLGVSPQTRQVGAHTAWTHGKLTIYQGDVMALTREQVPGLGAIWDRGALVALPETMRASYAPHLRSLMDGGRVLLNSLYYGPCEKKGPPHSISQQMLEQLYPAAHLDRVIHRDDSDGIRDTWREMGMTELFIDVWRIELG